MKNVVLRSILEIKKLTAETLELRSSLERSLFLFIGIHEDGVKIASILNYADVSPLAARQHVQRLIDLGYIQISNDPKDNRVKLVGLTADGHERIAKLEKSVAHIFGNLDPGSTGNDGRQPSAKPSMTDYWKMAGKPE